MHFDRAPVPGGVFARAWREVGRSQILVAYKGVCTDPKARSDGSDQKTIRSSLENAKKQKENRWSIWKNYAKTFTALGSVNLHQSLL